MEPLRRPAQILILVVLSVMLVVCCFASFRGEDWQELEVGQRALDRPAFQLLTQLDAFGLYRPLVNLYHGTMHRIWGLQPFPHFAALLLIFAANGWMVARIARLRGASSGAAWLTGAVAWVQVNTYAWSLLWLASAGRALAVLFWLLALLLHHRAVRLAGRGRPTAWIRLCTFLSMLLALLCKEEAIVVVPVLIFLEAARWKHLDREQRRVALHSIGMLAVFAAIYVALRLTLLPTPTGGPGSYYRMRVSWNWWLNLGFFLLHLGPLPILYWTLRAIARRSGGQPGDPEARRARQGLLEGLGWAAVAIQIYLPLGGRSYGFLYAPALGLAMGVGRGLAGTWAAARVRGPATHPAAVLALYWILAATAVGLALHQVGWMRYREVAREAFAVLDRTLPIPPPGARFVFLDPLERETASGRSLFNMVFDNVPLSMVRLHYRRPDLTGSYLSGRAALAALDAPPQADVVFLARRGRLTVVAPGRFREVTARRQGGAADPGPGDTRHQGKRAPEASTTR